MSAAKKAAAAAVPRFRSALKKLSQHGVDALMPKLIVHDDVGKQNWRPPLISNRVANVLRKQAVREGTYGSFNTETLKGWDSAWDVELAKAKARGQGRHRLKVPKKAKRHRTREERAAKIEKKMEGMDERIEEYYVEKHSKKPPRSFENYYKKLMRVKK